jgi:PhnB protein
MERAMQLANYLFFTTHCEPALTFYSECGLGRVVELVRHSSGALRGKIMHAKFEGPGVLFCASDNHDAEPMRGSAHYLTVDDREQTTQLFERLAAGGTITTALGIQPWGAYYGKLTDRFGVQWMLPSGRTSLERYSPPSLSSFGTHTPGPGVPLSDLQS